jgi:hypothetical protein
MGLGPRVHSAALPGTAAIATVSHVYAYAFAASILVVMAAATALVHFRVKLWPGAFFAILGIEALVVTVAPPPDMLTRALVLALGVALCVGEIAIVQFAGSHADRERDRNHREILRWSEMALAPSSQNA